MLTHLYMLCPSRRKVSSLVSFRTALGATASSAAGFCSCSSSCSTKTCLVYYFRKNFDPSSSTVDARQYTDNATQYMARRGLVLRAGTQTPGAFCPKTKNIGHPTATPLSLKMGHAIMSGPPHHCYPPAGAQNHEQPSKHCLLLLQPVEQPPVGGHTPRLNTAPVPPPPPAMAYTQVTKHILALGALVLTLLPGREPALLNPALAPISPTLNQNQISLLTKRDSPSCPHSSVPRTRRMPPLQ